MCAAQCDSHIIIFFYRTEQLRVMCGGLSHNREKY